MTSHTPGPWVVFGRTVRPAYPNQGSTTGYKPLADATGDKRFVSEEQSLANARLIAAAPDQNEALKLTQILLERLGLESSDEYQRNAAALAKALGE